MNIVKTEGLVKNSKNITLISLTCPLFIQSFLGLLMGNVNVLMLSKLSDQAVGAVGLANQVMGLLIVMNSLIGLGTAIIISQYIGAGMKHMAAKVANVAIVFNSGFGVIVSIVLMVFARQLLHLMNVPEEFMDYAYTYTFIVGGASFTQSLLSTMSSIARSYGFTKFPMFVTLGMNVVNVIGTYIALHSPFGIPSYGVKGVAISSVVSSLLGVVCLTYILFKKLEISFTIKDFYPLPIKTLKDILKVGSPAAVEYISYMFSQMTTVYFLTMIGAIAITTRVYAQNLTFFIYVLGMSVGQGTQILIGHLIGAGKEDAAYARGIRSIKIALISNAIMSIIFIILGRKLFDIFTDDPVIINIGSTILIIDFVVEAGRALNHVVGSSLRGAGDVRYPMYISIISMWGVSVTLSFFFGIWCGLGLIGVWIAFAADECFRGLVLLRRWRSGSWKRMALVSVDKSIVSQGESGDGFSDSSAQLDESGDKFSDS